MAPQRIWKTFLGFGPDLQNRLKETVHSSPHCKSLQTYKIMVGVTFNTINIYICIVVRSFYHNKVKFDFYTTLLRLTFIWYLILKFLCSTVFFPLWERFETTRLRIKIKIKIRIKNPDCVTKALFSNISNITFVQILVIYLYTNMHCYY